MKEKLKFIYNSLIIILIFIILFFGIKLIFDADYNIEYNNSSKDEIRNFIRFHNIKLIDCTKITNVTMTHIMPNAYLYTIYYIDSTNKKQSEEISLKSDTSLKDYIIANSENIEEKYINICKIVFYILIVMIIIKAIDTYITNKKK